MSARIGLAILCLVAVFILPACPTAPTPPAVPAGILDFRIAVLPAEIGADLPAAEDSFKTKGPGVPVKANGTTARWFEIDPMCVGNFTGGNFVTISHAGTLYILCYDDHDHTLTHADPKRKPWVVSAGNPYSDPTSGGVQLPFRLDPVGATYMGEVTLANVKHPLTMLINDRALTAPTIQSSISDRGVLTFGVPTPAHPAAAILKEANDIKAGIDAGNRSAVVTTASRPVTSTSPTTAP